MAQSGPYKDDRDKQRPSCCFVSLSLPLRNDKRWAPIAATLEPDTRWPFIQIEITSYRGGDQDAKTKDLKI